MLRLLKFALLGMLLAVSTASARPGGPAPFELSSSAILFYDREYEPWYGQPVSQCELLLTRIKATGAKRVSIVNTQYWMQEDYKQFDKNTCHPDNWAVINHVADSPKNYFCHKMEWNSDCTPWTDHDLAYFAAGLKKCIAKAAELFDVVLITPHLDDGTGTMHWRNMLWMDPLQKDAYGYSYWDIMVKPLLDAVNEAYDKPTGKKVWFSPQGEMGGTVFQYPGKYREVIKRIRNGFTGPDGVMTVGLTFNHAMLPGVINRDDDVHGALPVSKFWKMDGGWGPLRKFRDWPRYAYLNERLEIIQDLINSVDFLGVSSYSRAGAIPTLADIESATRKYAAELKEMGIDLKAWREQPGKKFIFNEFGLGCGISECGDTPATTRAECGRYPWLGFTKTFTPEKNPFSNPVNRQYAIDYYRKAMEYAKMGGLEYKVDGMFLWTIVSWDVFGIHPASSTWGCTDLNTCSYAIPELAKEITDFNLSLQKKGGERAARRAARKKIRGML